jgi:hypothetical protein
MCHCVVSVSSIVCGKGILRNDAVAKLDDVGRKAFKVFILAVLVDRTVTVSHSSDSRSMSHSFDSMGL